MFNRKDLLAKLLATEDVTVMHANAQTASFDVKNRVLTLPVWNDMSNETYDHLTGHEVGHALYTPADGWEKELDKGLGDGFKSFLNVVEDARIEKLIQRRYPGLRRSFVTSYKKMLADGFFGGDIDQLNSLPIIDRINTFFKAGPTAGVRIEKDEQVWIDEIEKLETWDEVVDVATRLYGYAKAKKDEESKQEDELNDFDFGDEDGDEDGDEENDFEFEKGEDDETDASDDGGSAAIGSLEDDVSSVTDKELGRNIDSNYNNDSGIAVKNVLMNDANAKELIVDYKKIINDFEDYDEKLRIIGEEMDWEGSPMGMLPRGEEKFVKFMANNKKAISYMTKEFEMRKSANDYVRATTSKTGVIDPIKMNSYLYNDDIFKKVTTVPEGKSHGMIMYLDWSGSMNYDMEATVNQLLNLVHFCRNVNIPFRVYAFTSGYYPENGDPIKNPEGLTSDYVPAEKLFYVNNFRYLEFFNSKMRKKEFVAMSKYLLALASNFRRAPYQYQLHGTPLDIAIMGASDLHDLFLKNHRVDIVNTIFLTDGDSHSANLKITNINSYDHLSSTSLSDLLGWKFEGQVNLVDPVTKKTYPLNSNQRRQEITEIFLKNYRLRTGSTTVGFRILPNGKNQIRRELYYLGYETDFSQLGKDMRKDKYCVIPSSGYTKYFGIAGGRALKTSNGQFETTGEETKSQLRNAFKKASRNKVTSRALLSEFIKEVA